MVALKTEDLSMLRYRGRVIRDRNQAMVLRVGNQLQRGLPGAAVSNGKTFLQGLFEVANKKIGNCRKYISELFPLYSLYV